MKKLNELFDVNYGNKFDLNKMTPLAPSAGGINFVGRSSQNHGVSGTVARVPGVAPYPAGAITVALGGTKLLSSFVQEHPFYTAQNVAILTPRRPMSFAQKLYVCIAIRHNRFRYSAFGREANRTLRTLEVPDLGDFPEWIDEFTVGTADALARPSSTAPAPELNVAAWQPFRYEQLFDIERGRGPRRKDLTNQGAVPFITSTDGSNGLTGRTTMAPCHRGNTIGVNRNGSVGEAFYQPVPFCSTEDVHIFNPRFTLTPARAMFLTTLIRRERYRFSYGRKWGIERMKKSTIRLPVDSKGAIDWSAIDRFVSTLPYSGALSGTPLPVTSPRTSGHASTRRAAPRRAKRA